MTPVSAGLEHSKHLLYAAYRVDKLLDEAGLILDLALCVCWVQGVKHMWQTDGMKGLFKGNGLNCIRIFPNSAIKFLCYEQITRWDSAQLRGLQQWVERRVPFRLEPCWWAVYAGNLGHVLQA